MRFILQRTGLQEADSKMSSCRIVFCRVQLRQPVLAVEAHNRRRPDKRSILTDTTRESDEPSSEILVIRTIGTTADDSNARQRLVIKPRRGFISKYWILCRLEK